MFDSNFKNKNIAYLAPDISYPFVHDEIIGLQKRDIKIIPISIHSYNSKNCDSKINYFVDNTLFIYNLFPFSTILNIIRLFISDSKRCFLTAKLLLDDVKTLKKFDLNTIKIIYHFCQAFSVAIILKKYQCQHLHIHFAHVSTQIGMYASSLASIPYSFTSHANDLFQRGLLLDNKIKRAKVAVTISDYNYNFLKKYTNNEEKLKIIRCGIDLNIYQFSIKEYDIKKNKVILKTLGRLVEKKGMDVLILAVANLKQKNIDFHLEIGGDGPLRSTLEDLVFQTQLSSHISFTGSVHHDQVSSWLKEADLFILACKKTAVGDYDGIPVVLMEAMAIGIPVISTDISGIPELIQEGVTGYLAQSDNPQSLANVIENRIMNLSSMNEVIENARQKIENDFNINKNINDLLKIFN
jgi:glycosyltransferase involved in cell wall biosynthesis